MLTQHHLQQLDRYHELLVGARVEAIAPFGWGVRSVAVDRRALESGQVRLASLTAVLPDGLVIRAEAGDPELPASRPVEGHFPHSREALEIYVGVPRERDGVANVADEGGARTRFVADAKKVVDLTGTGGELEVRFARRNLHLLFGDEPKDDFECLKVAEVVRDDGGALTVSEPYVPPILRLEASPFLLAGIRRVLRLMSTRRRALSEQARERGDSMVEYNAGDITRFLLLNAVNQYLPVLSHMVDTPEVSPREAYVWLVSLAGQLTTFSAEADPAELPKFQYTDLRATFEPLFGRITELLQASIKEHYVSLTLDGREDGMHLGQIVDARMVGCERYLLAVRTSAADQDIASTLPRLSKVASWGDINGILSAATPGAPVEVTFQPPPEIPVKAGSVYFNLSTNNSYWRNIVNDRQIAVYLPRPFDPAQTQVELLGIPRKA